MDKHAISLEGLVSANLVDSGCTRSQFADKLGIKSWRTLKHKVRGESQMTFSEAVLLSKQIGVTLEELFELIPR